MCTIVLQTAKKHVRLSFSSRIICSKIFISVCMCKIVWENFHIIRGLDSICITCLIYSVVSSGDVSWFAQFQISFWMFFMFLGMEVIEIHLQINKLIAAIGNFTIKWSKKAKLTFSVLPKNLVFSKFSDFSLLKSKIQKSLKIEF